MKKKISFEKDITFKTKIGELTSISLDDDLTLKGENSVVGSFYIGGTYKMLKDQTSEEEYSYKIPCEITISDEYDTYDSTIDIEDFTYEVINDEILRIKIEVAINNLERKEKEETENIKEAVITDDLRETNNKNIKEEKDEIGELIEKINKNERCIEEENIEIIDKLPEVNKKTQSLEEVKNKLKNKEESYLTYSVYIYKEEDSIEKILEKYKISIDELKDYNNLEEITIGSKLLIPSFND